MKAVWLNRHGGPEVLKIAEVPAPAAGPGEVRVKIHFAGINYPDVLARGGLYGWVSPLPYILGMEACGEIDQIGAGSNNRSLGEVVIVAGQSGMSAEYVCVPSNRALPLPTDFTAIEGAAFSVNYLTAWIGLMEMARLRSTDTVLITSAAGGVGSAAIQLAKCFGATVLGASRGKKLETIRRLGADAAFDYGQTHWKQELLDFTKGRGPDVVFDLVGAKIYRDCVSTVAPLGRVVLAGLSSVRFRRRQPWTWFRAARSIPKVDTFDLLRRSYGITSFHVGRLLADERRLAGIWNDLTAFVATHRLRPLVGGVYPMSDVARVHAALESRESVGKLVLAVNPVPGASLSRLRFS